MPKGSVNSFPGKLESNITKKNNDKSTNPRQNHDKNLGILTNFWFFFFKKEVKSLKKNS